MSSDDQNLLNPSRQAVPKPLTKDDYFDMLQSSQAAAALFPSFGVPKPVTPSSLNTTTPLNILSVPLSERSFNSSTSSSTAGVAAADASRISQLADALIKENEHLIRRAALQQIESRGGAVQLPYGALTPLDFDESALIRLEEERLNQARRSRSSY